MSDLYLAEQLERPSVFDPVEADRLHWAQRESEVSARSTVEANPLGENRMVESATPPSTRVIAAA